MRADVRTWGRKIVHFGESVQFTFTRRVYGDIITEAVGVAVVKWSAGNSKLLIFTSVKVVRMVFIQLVSFKKGTSEVTPLLCLMIKLSRMLFPIILRPSCPDVCEVNGSQNF